MDFEYGTGGVIQGRKNQQKYQETPTTFGSENNVGKVTQTTRLDKPEQRMAGQMGERILEFMENPEEQERTLGWLQAFGRSNEGMQFNQARMMLSGQAPPGAEEGGQQ